MPIIAYLLTIYLYFMKKFRTLLTSSAILLASVAFGQNFDNNLPSNPTPGKCYVKCITPNVFETKEVTVMTAPEYTVLKVVPAEFRTEKETIMSKPAYKEYSFTPAKFKTEYVTVGVEPDYNKVSIIPAKFKRGSEEIEVSPMVGKWEYGTLPGCKSVNPEDCRTLCWKETPARYKTIPTQVLESDARTTTTLVKGSSKKYPILVLDVPAKVNERTIPAEYKTVTKRVKVKDETTTATRVPAVYKTERVKVLKSKGGVTVWEEVDCNLVNYSLLPIYYDLGSARLRESSKSIIDRKIYDVMKQKPNISVEIASHTDSRGDAASNQDLSQRRAQAVVDYLVAKGIERSRLVAKGYGETRLVNKCSDGVNCSDAEHQRNRRTEFRIIGVQ